MHARDMQLNAGRGHRTAKYAASNCSYQTLDTHPLPRTCKFATTYHAQEAKGEPIQDRLREGKQ
jgi:hypothetical protein